ncbi:MAG: hypothetical protein U0840_29805 [Gemmataceae bacterium]
MSDAREHDNWLFGGLAALCAAVLTQLVDRPVEAFSILGFGVMAFALALPLLVCSAIMGLATTRSRSKSRIVMDALGLLSGVAGFVCLFFHISTVAGWVFLGTAGLAMLHFVRESRRAT